MIWLLPAIKVVTILVVLLNLPIGLIWLERRLLAGFQDRYGPNRVGPLGLLQPLADALKLMMKEDWLPPFADRYVFIIAPASSS
jgi:NADH-quinone oxidoreductase subunit H